MTESNDKTWIDAKVTAVRVGTGGKAVFAAAIAVNRTAGRAIGETATNRLLRCTA
jgi:hypothetical protein